MRGFCIEFPMIVDNEVFLIYRNKKIGLLYFHHLSLYGFLLHTLVSFLLVFSLEVLAYLLGHLPLSTFFPSLTNACQPFMCCPLLSSSPFPCRFIYFKIHLLGLIMSQKQVEVCSNYTCFNYGRKPSLREVR